MKDPEKLQQEGDHIALPVRIILAVTSALAWVFFVRTIGMLRDAGYEPHLGVITRRATPPHSAEMPVRDTQPFG